LFERSLVEFNFRGFKVYPPCGFSPSDPALFQFYEICSHYQMPVLIHVGPTSPALDFRYSSPFLVDEAARLFPTVNFILAHGSVNFVEECVMMCRFRPNVYLDISGYQNTLGHDPSAGVVRSIVSRGINHKVLFGTDFPVFRLQGEQADFIEVLIGQDGALAHLNEREKALVLSENVARLLEKSVPVGV
jgi:predicted TIM-barrel fold metal-dependent hydrolase